MAGAVFRVFVVGAVSLTPIKQNKTLAKFFSAPFEASFKFAKQKRLWPKFCIIFCDFNFDVLLTVLVVFSFLFFLLGDYLIKIDDICSKNIIYLSLFLFIYFIFIFVIPYFGRYSPLFSAVFTSFVINFFHLWCIPRFVKIFSGLTIITSIAQIHIVASKLFFIIWPSHYH